MKQTIITLSAVALLTGGLIGTGCKKSSNNGNNTGSSIVGSWEARSEHATQTINTTPPFNTTTDSTYAAGTGPYIEFRSNGIYVSKANYNASSTEDSGTYSLINNSKIVSTSAGSTTADTADISITGNQFVTSSSETFTQSGFTYTTSYSVTFVKR